MPLRAFFHPLSLAAVAALFLSMLMILFPESALQASLRGVAVWWQVLFPALFPFFVISELLLGLGIVHFFGRLLDPLMRPLFRLPGTGGFVVAMGYMSGYPVGARLTAQLWEQKLINRSEGERLVAFTTTSDPVFLIGAVSVGFFHNAALAPILAAAHYGGGLAIGLLMRFHDRGVHLAQQRPLPSSGQSSRPSSLPAVPSRSRLYSALKAMHEARLLDGRSAGQLLNDALWAALKLMIVVGGLVVFFSVVMEMLSGIGLTGALTELLRLTFEWAGIPGQLADAVVFGLFEVTLGARAAGEAGTGLLHQTAMAAWVLSWGGISVHAQIASLLSRTDLRYTPLLLARLLHGLIAAGLVYLLWGTLGP